MSDIPSDENVKQKPEEELSERQLREIYDDEEIDRFLHLFSAYITEVRIPDTGDSTEEPASEDVVDSEAPTEGSSPNSQFFSEIIAKRCLVPILPPAPIPSQPFTIGRLRLATQRLYLSVQPVYIPFFSSLGHLATWEDKNRSLTYCTAFWILWWYNLLLPALFLRILYSLMRRKIMPYPTLDELRRHRREVQRATEFGDQVQERLTASSPFGIQEVWRLFKVFNKSKKNKVKKMAKRGTKDTLQPSNDLDGAVEDEPTVFDDVKDPKEEKDIKNLVLNIMNEITDLHERVRNIFIWRRHSVSVTYATVIFLLFLVVLCLPAKCLAKLVYAIGGIAFWHVTPVIVALPPSERARLPPAFSDAPTDSDYAMEVISHRVATGLDVNPKRVKKNTREEKNSQDDGSPDLVSTQDEPEENKEKRVQWKKWGERIATGKSWVSDGRRLLVDGQLSRDGNWPPRNPLVPQPALAVGAPEVSADAHTFPARHTSGPGLITVTPTTFFFTPLMSQHASIVTPLADLHGVKKVGILKGLSLRICPIQDGTKPILREEKFSWVGGRDELFARIIGFDGKRWLKG